MMWVLKHVKMAGKEKPQSPVGADTCKPYFRLTENIWFCVSISFQFMNVWLTTLSNILMSVILTMLNLTNHYAMLNAPKRITCDSVNLLKNKCFRYGTQLSYFVIAVIVHICQWQWVTYIWGLLLQRDRNYQLLLCSTDRSHCKSINLKWKTLVTTKTLPRAGCQAKLSNNGRSAPEWWPRRRYSLWLSSKGPVWRGEKIREGQLSLQHSTNLGFIAQWPDGSLLVVKNTWKEFGETKFCGLVKPRLNFWLNSILSIM